MKCRALRKKLLQKNNQYTFLKAFGKKLNYSFYFRNA